MVADPARLGHVHGPAAERGHDLSARRVPGDAPDRARQAAEGDLEVVVEDLDRVAGRGPGANGGRRGEQAGAVDPGGVDHHLLAENAPSAARAVTSEGSSSSGTVSSTREAPLVAPVESAMASPAAATRSRPRSERAPIQRTGKPLLNCRRHALHIVDEIRSSG